MVAGDSRRVVVIKNISSDLIEEAILILKSDPGKTAEDDMGKAGRNRSGLRNDFLLKEAECIINEYIKEHGLTAKRDKRLYRSKLTRFRMSADTFVNILLASAVVLLLAIIAIMLCVHRRSFLFELSVKFL